MPYRRLILLMQSKKEKEDNSFALDFNKQKEKELMFLGKLERKKNLLLQLKKGRNQEDEQNFKMSNIHEVETLKEKISFLNA